MQPDIETTLRDVRAAVDGWSAVTDRLSSGAANWRPAPDRWSIAQCMEHLNSTTGKLLLPLRAAVDSARAKRIECLGPFRYGFIGRWFLRSVAPERATRAAAPKAYLPAASALDLVHTRREFFEIHERFAECAASADGLDLSRIRVASPAMPLLRLQLGIWLLSTASHALRHLHQAETVRNEDAFPAERVGW